MSSTQVGHWWLIVISNRYQIWYHTHIWHWSNFHWASKSHNAKSFAQYMLEVSHPNSGQCLVSKGRIIFRSKKLWLLFALKFDGEEKNNCQPSLSVCVLADRGLSPNHQTQGVLSVCETNMCLPQKWWQPRLNWGIYSGFVRESSARTWISTRNSKRWKPEELWFHFASNWVGLKEWFAAFLGEGLFQNIGRGRRGQGLQVVYQWPTEPNITSVPSLG